MWWAELLNIIAGTLSSGAPGIPPFPLPLTNVKAWYDAADTSSISLSGSAVTQWNDKSGNGYNVTQGTATNRPASGVSTLNTLNVIDFDGVDNFLTAATASNWTFLKSNTAYLTCMVVKLGTGAVRAEDYMGVINLADSASEGGTNYYADYRVSRQRFSHTQNNASLGSVIVNDADASFAEQSYYNIGVLGDPANATAANRSKIFKNTGTAITNNTQTAAADTGAPARPLEIGRYSNTFGYLQGSIAEIVIFNATGATDANRISIRDYFTAKWGI